MGYGGKNNPILDINISGEVGQQLDTVSTKLNDVQNQVTKPKTVEEVIEKMIKKLPVTIVAKGDSVTWGYVPNSGTQTANPYPKQLQALLREYYGYNEIYVINQGNSGKQSDEFASDTYVNEVITANPDMVIFMCGINDCRGGTSGGVVVPVKDYKENIATMVGKLSAYPFIFMTPTFFQDTEEVKSRFTQYVKAMREMASKLSVNLIDLYSIVLEDLEKRKIAFSDVAPDDTHFTDEYYKRLAEYVFAFGLCNNNIVVKKEKFFSPLDSVFRWKNGVSNYYNSSINPLKRNIFLNNGVADFTELTAYLYIDGDDFALQSHYVPNATSSPNNSVEINGVTYSQPLSTPAQTIWNLKEKKIALKHGLNKIVYKTSSANASKLFFLLYGVSIVKQEEQVIGVKKLFTGPVNISSATVGTQKRTKLLSLKDNNFNKVIVKFTPTGIDSGIAFGTGLVNKDGSVIEYPLALAMQGGSYVVKLFDLRMNTNSALYNADGKLNFGELFASTAAYSMNAENTLTVTLNSDDYVFNLNGTNIFTLPKSTFNVGVFDVWGYSVNTSSFTINEISISS